MVKLEFLSDNLIIILEKLLENQTLCKLIQYDLKNPLDQPDIIDTESLLFNRILPTPFDQFTATEDFSQVRAYYSRVDFKGEVVENHQLFFDVIVSKSLWLVKTDKRKIRPYEIVKEIVNTFHGKSIDTLGKVKFSGFRHWSVNDKFDAVQMPAKIVSFTDGE